MRDVLGVIVLISAFALAAMAVGAMAAWRLEPGRRTLRALSRVLGAAPEAAAIAAPRGQGLGIRVSDGHLAVVRGPGDRGLIYDLDELYGVELIFDGQVAARMHRGEPRRALDQIFPQAARVIVRLVFDDLRDPEFELELLAPADFSGRSPPDPQMAVQEGRRWFARLEAVIRRAGSEAGPGR
jgi:hypothetical protein